MTLYNIAFLKKSHIFDTLMVSPDLSRNFYKYICTYSDRFWPDLQESIIKIFVNYLTVDEIRPKDDFS